MRAAMERLAAPQPRWAVVASVAEVGAFGLPCVLKVTRGGYDGRGVWVVRYLDEDEEPLVAAQRSGVPLLADVLVDFRRNLSALFATALSVLAVPHPVLATTLIAGLCHHLRTPPLRGI